MNQPHQYGEDQDEPTVIGFEVPRSPDASYNNVYPGNEDEGREPPMLPSHLHHTLLNHQATRDQSASLPLPQNVVLNHLYIENREAPRSVVALGFKGEEVVTTPKARDGSTIFVCFDGNNRGKYTAIEQRENIYFYTAACKSRKNLGS
uniref:SNF1-related protein kinase regulatory subunit beta-3-like n=1 Tax=Nicotiana sylvestris TaxID=4096 RepID=A0A1U7V4R5_NICSY|nr:PREDICTED: SNF1-related protein kinase regulatory subunit beta-3-like [Nicotiana sylvestris]